MGIGKSAGLAIVCGDEILLVHPTNAPWTGTYSIPKGLIEDFETAFEAAIRETKEEIGLDITVDMIESPGDIIYYRKANNKIYKKVFYFIVRLDKKPEIKKENLQLDEVDWAGFVHKDEVEEKIFWRFLPILEKVFER